MLLCGNPVVTLRHWVVNKSHDRVEQPTGVGPIGLAVGAMVGVVGEAVVVNAVQFRTIAPAVKGMLHGLFRKAFESI
jgi:hypothetical protein